MALLTPAADFLSFPPETIQEILKFLTGKDLKILRLVCTQLNIAIEPNLLSSLFINESTLKPDICQLEILATGKTRATLHARKLIINFYDVLWSDSWEQGFDEISTEDHIEKYLISVLLSLHNLDCLVWLVNGGDPYWTRYTIVDTIARLPLLQDVQIILSSHLGSPHLQLDRLSGLTKILLHGMCIDYCSNLISKMAKAIARGPHITHLEIHPNGLNWGFVREAPSLHQILSSVPPGTTLRLTHLALHEIFCKIDAFTLPHLRSLVSLDLCGLPTVPCISPMSSIRGGRTRTSSTVSEIFAVLTLEKIHLRHIVVDNINDAVVSYLESYSSILERLEMIPSRCPSAEESDALAERFYSCALPKHAETIQVLNIQPTFEGEWCYSPQVASALSQCQRLASLTIKLPSMVPAKPSRSSDPPDGSYSFDHMFTSIADLSLRSPRLTEVNLTSANPELYRSAPTLTSSLCTISVSRPLAPLY